MMDPIIRSTDDVLKDYENWMQLVKEYDPDLTDAQIADAWYELNSENGYTCLFIEVGGKVAGFALVTVHDFMLTPRMRLYLAALYVCPEFRRQGLATKLVHYAIDEAKRRKLDGVYWVTEPQNPARKLYDKLASPEFVRYHFDF